MDLALRPATHDDEEFLFQVYASTRAEEMGIVPWDDQQKQEFLQMQFNAQTQYYKQQYPRAVYSIILHDSVSAGRLIVNRGENISIIDIALLPEHRNYGIGSKFIADLKTEAQQTGKPLRLHVENFNRAYQLYERLGFSKIDEAGFYWLMEWRPSPEGQDLKSDLQNSDCTGSFANVEPRVN
jgi:ribosomal protein S18 acetylase RimI-like enzyme